MGWRGTVRSLNALSKSIDRENKRREKRRAIALAGIEADEHEQHIDRLQSVHKAVSESRDWNTLASLPEPQKPQRSSENEKRAKLKLDSYKPNFIDRLFKWQEKKKKKLGDRINKAIEKDEENYNNATTKYESAYESWKVQNTLAQRILNGDPEAYIDAIKKYSTMQDVSELGSKISFSADNSKIIEVLVHSHGENIIPKEEKKLLKSGKLSIKEISQGKFNQLYQDYICGCLLRIANETFSLLPIEGIIATAVDKRLDVKTGHLEDQPIVSAYIVRKTLETLNLEGIDPSESMRNFLHEMNFKKGEGFLTVKKIERKDLNSSSQA